jgi:serine/threonine-protein kinase
LNGHAGCIVEGPVTLAPGTVVAQRYALVSPIDGGIGCVWAAEHVSLGRRVAIKVVPRAQADPKGTFIRDARAAAAVRHRGVVAISDFGIDGGHAYVVMEMLEGQTLAARLASPLFLSQDDLLEIASGALAGLAALHDGGVVHGNLCPHSIFLAREEEAVVPKIIGVGLTRGSAGANAYMSPERALRRADLDARADVFGMGVVLYEGLTGRTPEPAISTFEFPRLATVRPGIPPKVAAVVERAIAVRRDGRWAGAREMRSALLEAAGVAPEPSQVVVPPARERHVTAPRPPGSGTNPTLVAEPKRRRAWPLVAAAAVLCAAVAIVAALATMPAHESSAVQRTAHPPASPATPASAAPAPETAAPETAAPATAAPASASPPVAPRRTKRGAPRSPTGLMDDPGF